MSKGLIGIALPAGVLATYVLVQRDFSLLRRLQWAPGIAIFLAIAAPWFLLVQHANPEFARFFFVHEHVERFLTASHRRVQPWWYFFYVLAVGMLPWTTLLPQALAGGWRIRQPDQAFQPARFLLIWVIFIFVFFSLSGSKLPSYILPVFPALALLVGLALRDMGTRWLLVHSSAALLTGIALVAYSPRVGMMGSEEVPSALYRAYLPWIVAGGLAFALGGAWALAASRLGKRAPALVGAGLAGLVGTQLLMTGHDALSPAYSGYQIARDIKPHLTEGSPFYSVRTYDQTLPFYIKRTVVLVAFQDEMAYGLEQEPHLGLPDFASFERAWRGERSPLAIMEPDIYAAFESKGLPMEIVARDPRRIVARKPGAAP
jgi:4-amino-4-deoxy-L-arabinose transferase-like glycosyltransferase